MNKPTDKQSNHPNNLTQPKKEPIKTHKILIEQTVFEPWKDKIDAVDCILINHVETRLNRRYNQKIIMVDGEPAVWVHYPTLRSENWLIEKALSVKQVGARFKKLVDAGLLVRKLVPRGSEGGSQTYFGLSKELKKAREEFDRRRNGNIQEGDCRENSSQTFGCRLNSSRFDCRENSSQSLSTIHSDDEDTESSSTPKGAVKDKSGYIEIVDKVKRLQVNGNRPHESLDFQNHVEVALSRLQEYTKLAIDDFKALILFIAKRETEPAHLLTAIDPDRTFFARHYKAWKQQPSLCDVEKRCPECGMQILDDYCVSCGWTGEASK